MEFEIEEKDKELWAKAVKEYEMDESKLLKEIVKNWLFQNKLKIEKEK